MCWPRPLGFLRCLPLPGYPEAALQVRARASGSPAPGRRPATTEIAPTRPGSLGQFGSLCRASRFCSMSGLLCLHVGAARCAHSQVALQVWRRRHCGRSEMGLAKAQCVANAKQRRCPPNPCPQGIATKGPWPATPQSRTGSRAALAWPIGGRFRPARVQQAGAAPPCWPRPAQPPAGTGRSPEHLLPTRPPAHGHRPPPARCAAPQRTLATRLERCSSPSSRRSKL